MSCDFDCEFDFDSEFEFEFECVSTFPFTFPPLPLPIILPLLLFGARSLPSPVLTGRGAVERLLNNPCPCPFRATSFLPAELSLEVPSHNVLRMDSTFVWLSDHIIKFKIMQILKSNKRLIVRDEGPVVFAEDERASASDEDEDFFCLDVGALFNIVWL